MRSQEPVVLAILHIRNFRADKTKIWRFAGPSRGESVSVNFHTAITQILQDPGLE